MRSRPSRSTQPPVGTEAAQHKQAPAPVEPGSSEGMPAKTPATGRPRPGQSATPQDASDESSLALPHERDQASNMTAKQPDPQIRQAARDLKQDLQDTGKSAAMNQTYQKLKGL
jgi:hypothetical protein